MALETSLGEATGSLLDGILEPDASILAPSSTPSLLSEAPPPAKKVEEEKKPEEKKPPVEEKKPDTKPIEDDDTPQVDPNEKSDRWKKFVPKYEEKKALVKKLNEDLKDFEGTRKERDDLKARIEKLEKENTELGKIDSISKLENHPDFKRKYVEAKEQSIEKLKKVAGMGEISADDLVAALNKSPKEKYAVLDDLTDGLPSALKSKIFAEVDRIETIDEQRQTELAAAQENLSKLTAQQREDARNEEAKRVKVFERVAERLKTELGLDDDAIADRKKFWMSNEDEERAVEILLREKVAEMSISEKKKLMATVAELEKEVAQYRKGGGALRAGGDPPADGADDKLDLVSFMTKKAREMGAIR